MPNAPETIEKDSEAHFRRFPIFLVAFSLMWLGALAPLDHLWSTAQSLPAPLISRDTAAIAFLLGTALFTACSVPLLSRMLAFFSLVVCVCLAAEGVAIDAESARTLLISLLSLAAICSSLGPGWRQAARIMSALVIIGTVYLRLISAWLPPSMYEHANSANLEALLGILTAGAIWATSRRPRTSRLLNHERMIAIIGIVGTFVSVAAWYAVTEQSRGSAHSFAQTATARVAESLRHEVSDQIALIDRMARRWDALDAIPPVSLVNEELVSYLGHIYTLEFIAVIDPSHTFHWAQGGDNQTRSWLAGYLGTPDMAMWLAHAHLNAQAQMRSIDSTTSSTPRSLIAVPLTSSSMKGWTIVAIQNLPVLISKALGPNLGQIQFRIQDNDRILYDSVGQSGRISHIANTAVPLNNGMSWILSSWHVQHWSQPVTLLPNLILLVCLAFTHTMIGLRKQALVLLRRSQQLYHSALHNSLTGLPNKASLENRLAEICQARGKGPVWLAIFELDGIKLINDTLGHGVGDYALQEATRRIVTEVGHSGFVAQIESNEFVVAMNSTSREAVTDLINRILDRFSAPYHFDNMELRLTASAGLTGKSVGMENPMGLVSEADLALGRAKREAPGAWREYSSNLSAAVAERLQLRNELQNALDTDALELHYQPVIERGTGDIVGVEALLRWFHPKLGTIPPIKFVPLAEDTGQIIQLTNWVLDRACHDLRRLRDRQLASFHVAINIPPLVFEHNDFIDTLSATLARHALPAECIALEITEGTMLGDQAITIARLKTLNALGIRTSIDDFGTGYSSLNYLKKLPIDKVKIDKSFVNEVISDSDDAAIVKAIIGLAHHLNLKVVAEGVETEAQYHFLNDNACDQFQGYLFAKPLSFAALAQRLREKDGREILPEAPTAGRSI